MNFGETIFTQSKRGFIIKSERYIGFSSRFHKKNASQYACASCKSLGKSRIVTVRNGRIYVRKHPEEVHHKDCRPIADVELCIQSTPESFSATLTHDPFRDPSGNDTSVVIRDATTTGIIRTMTHPTFRRIRWISASIRKQ